MTVAQAAKALEVSPALVYKLLKAGKLAHSRIGFGRGMIRIDESSLAEFRRGCEVGLASGDEGPVVKKVRGNRIVIPDGFAESQRVLDRLRAERRSKAS